MDLSINYGKSPYFKAIRVPFDKNEQTNPDKARGYCSHIDETYNYKNAVVRDNVQAMFFEDKGDENRVAAMLSIAGIDFQRSGKADKLTDPADRIKWAETGRLPKKESAARKSDDPVDRITGIEHKKYAKE